MAGLAPTDSRQTQGLTAFAAFENYVVNLPIVKDSATIELIEEDGKWLLDDLPFADLF